MDFRFPQQERHCAPNVTYNSVRVSIVAVQKELSIKYLYVWVWNLVVDTVGGKEAEGVWEQGVEENIWS